MGRASVCKSRNHTRSGYFRATTIVLALAGTILVLQGCGAGNGRPAHPVERTAAPNFPRPTIPPPKYRVYRQLASRGLISVVVDSATTDEQIKSLLWFFREKVRAQELRELHMTERLTDGGFIIIFRGNRCADEDFVDNTGPCGRGDHDAASYQWGIHGNPDWDTGTVVNRNGQEVVAFDSSVDHWQLTSEVQGKLQTERVRREQYASALTQSYAQEGVTVIASAYGTNGTTLNLLTRFEHLPDRELFARKILMDKQIVTTLCGKGFIKLGVEAVGEDAEDFWLPCQ